VTWRDAFGWLDALREPRQALAWSAADWHRVVRLARRLRLLARLAAAMDTLGPEAPLPEPVRRHLLSEQRLSAWRLRSVTWAMQRIGGLLAEAPYPRVLLKGAAYVAQGLPNAAGRLPSDLDLLVPREHLDDAVARLQAAGWQSVELDEHDQRYYREWSHEVPPMRHTMIGVELDLHHNILPPVARTRVDAAPLLARVQASPLPGWHVLHPVDQALHCAAHLFHDAELRDRLRDLVDFDALLRHFGGDASTGAAFWDELPRRATELGLTESLAWATHFCVAWLRTPVPAACAARIAAQGPGWLRRALPRLLFACVLTPTEPDALPSRRQAAAATLLLVRHHLHRLPLRLLLPHLWHKWRTARRAQDVAADDPPQPSEDRG
jgi:hypothetical protein